MKEILGTFYTVSAEEIKEAEREMGIEIQYELKQFYGTTGYGFLKSINGNINRIMDPLSIRDFRLRQNDFQNYPDIEIYNDFEKDKIIFFEANDTALMSIECSKNDASKIFYYDKVIARSLEEFINKMHENDEYYLQ